MSTVSPAATVRPISSLRREEDIAADAVWALFAAGLIPTTAVNVIAAARAAQIHPGRLREAQGRREHGLVEKPSRRVVRARDLFDYPSAPYEPNSREGNDKKKAAKEPRPGRRICSKCKKEKPVGEFQVKNKATGQRRARCIPCTAEDQRTRYLDVEKQKLMNAARLAFVVRPGDRVVGLVCVDCGCPIRVGEKVHGQATLHHDACPAAPMPLAGAHRPRVTVQ